MSPRAGRIRAPHAAWLLVAVALAGALAGALTLGGTAPFGRLALDLGLPATALLDDPLWRGAALYRQGRFEAAAEAFRVAGPRGSFNRGNALARAGRYRAALAAYDAALFRDPGHGEARANRALIAALVEDHQGEARAGGGIDAAGEGSAPPRAGGGDAAAPRASAPSITAGEQELVRRALTGQAVLASRQWLATLADEPGRYLKRRLAAERARRLDLGLAAASGDPW